ncbi:hypothetical protein HQ447_20025 [bacterium]|nr:hypothetical protein [bacterium]
MVKALRGEENAKKRDPLEVFPPATGIGITDGNATAQAMTIAGLTEVPVHVAEAGFPDIQSGDGAAGSR